MRPAAARPGRTGLPRRLLPLALLCLAAASQGDPVAEFRRLLARDPEPAARAEAVLVLRGYESPRVVDELVPLLDGEPEVADAAVRVLGAFLTRPPVERMLELAGRGAPAERVGLLRALSLGRYGGTGAALEPLLADARWDVRRAALEALAAAGDRARAPAFERLAADPEPAVRCAALEGLAALDPAALLRAAPAALADGVWQVRASAIAAVGNVRERAAVALLVGRLRAEDGRLRQDLAQALEGLTGRAFGLAPEPWERFLETVGEGYAPPTADELARLAAQRAVTRQKYEGQVRFHGVETPSRSILFVIDVSSSMASLVVGEGAPADGAPLRRVDLVKQELARAIDALEPYVRFNVVAFATDLDEWRRELTIASKSNKRSALRWVERLDAHDDEDAYVHLQEGATPARVSGLLALERGFTNTHAALMRALEVGGRGTFDRHYEVALDTVLFLSDGDPTAGEHVLPDDILRDVARANRLRRVAIHTIAIGEFNKAFMEDLARQNGGTFVDLGR